MSITNIERMVDALVRENELNVALQEYANFLKANYASRSPNTRNRQLVVEFDKGNKFIKVI
jgi:hypothetical protein